MGERLQRETVIFRDSIYCLAGRDSKFTVSLGETANTVSASETANTVSPAETANAVSRALFIQRVINTPPEGYFQRGGEGLIIFEHFKVIQSRERAEVLNFRPLLDNQALT